MESPELTPHEVKGRITVLKVIQYKDHPIYIRKIGSIFEYLLIHEGQIFSSYLVITPKEGKKRLSKDEINQSAALILTGAIATIDTLLGEKVSEEMELLVEDFEEKRDLVDESKDGKDLQD